jgi:hypothetical protein
MLFSRRIVQSAATRTVASQCVASSIGPSTATAATASPLCVAASASTFAQTRLASSRPPRREQNAPMPVKDRYPPAAYDPADPRRRLCVLVDGHLVSCRSFKERRAEIEKHGNILLTRVLAHELLPEWQPEVADRRAEWFRVEKFIPVHMQIAADAGHVARFRADNSIEGIVFLVADAETPHFEHYLDRPELRDLNLYCFSDEKGLTKMRNTDGRAGNGAN